MLILPDEAAGQSASKRLSDVPAARQYGADHQDSDAVTQLEVSLIGLFILCSAAHPRPRTFLFVNFHFGDGPCSASRLPGDKALESDRDSFQRFFFLLLQGCFS